MGDTNGQNPRDPRESLLWDTVGSQSGAAISSPAGGPGPGRFKQFTPQQPSSTSATTSSTGGLRDRMYHEAVKAGVRVIVGPGVGLLTDYLLDRFEKNANYVAEACRRALARYVGSAIQEETGRALDELIHGLLQGLVMMMAVVAATTLIGAGAGAAVGFFCFGVGAAPGAAVGAELGFDAGLWILEWLGIGFLAVYIAANLSQVVKILGQGVVRAFNAGDHGVSVDQDIDAGARNIARAIGILVRLILEGIVLYLLAKGAAAVAERLPALLSALRESKLGKGFAEWVGKNYKSMTDDPKLNPNLRQSGAAAAKAGEEAGPTPGESRPGKAAARAGRAVSAQEAEDILISKGMSKARASQFVRSFDDGPIRVRDVEPGEQFYRYSGVENGKGSFLAKEAYSSPEEAVKALHLEDYGNPATFRQAVTATQPTTVLEGGVRGGQPPGAPQT